MMASDLVVRSNQAALGDAKQALASVRVNDGLSLLTTRILALAVIDGKVISEHERQPVVSRNFPFNLGNRAMIPEIAVIVCDATPGRGGS